MIELPASHQHTLKAKRFPKADNPNIAENEAFILGDAETRAVFAKAYDKTSALYHRFKPTFDQILVRISEWAGRL